MPPANPVSTVPWSDSLAAVSTALSAIAVIISLFVSVWVYRGQKLLAQRQLLVPLWSYLASLNRIDPTKPITPDVLKCVNTLELVALCCEGGMVDPKVIRRTFRAQFVELYHSIEQCIAIPGLTKSGKDLLQENPATMALYKQLQEENMARDRLN